MKVKLSVNLSIQSLNKFYKRNNIKINDYMFLIGYIKESEIYLYTIFNDFDNLIEMLSMKILTCDKKYINDNFTEIDMKNIGVRNDKSN